MGNFLKEFPNAHVTIIGHTDNTGTKEENLQLSLVRAAVVKSHIIYKFKIDRSHISIKELWSNQAGCIQQNRSGQGEKPPD